MCGIAGVRYQDSIDSPESVEALLRSMADQLVHRGPDDEGFFINGPTGLAHRRLSIIDLATGHQPMLNERADIAIVFNGEIFNYLELKADLEKKGRQFRTTSDTEVIIQLYEELGLEFVH